MKQIACLLALTCCASLAQAETPEHYHYGMNLDIAKVISQSRPEGCAPGESRMVYLDSKGQRLTLVYLSLGENCND